MFPRAQQQEKLEHVWEQEHEHVALHDRRSKGGWNLLMRLHGGKAELHSGQKYFSVLLRGTIVQPLRLSYFNEGKITVI